MIKVMRAPFSGACLIVVQTAVTALALLIFGKRFEQVYPAKIRPQRWRHIDLGIS